MSGGRRRGRRTLLIDADVRRGSQHTTFDRPASPGLIDALRNEASPSEVVYETNVTRLSLMPCGTRLRTAPELLASRAFAELLHTIRHQFDVVIVDTAPLCAGIDAAAVGTAIGHAVLVLRTGATDRKMADNRLRMLARLPIAVHGTVLNAVRTNTNEYRYYNYSYGYAETPVGDDVSYLPPAPRATSRHAKPRAWG